jgi:hypothetical protein
MLLHTNVNVRCMHTFRMLLIDAWIHYECYYSIHATCLNMKALFKPVSSTFIVQTSLIIQFKHTVSGCRHAWLDFEVIANVRTVCNRICYCIRMLIFDVCIPYECYYSMYAGLPNVTVRCMQHVWTWRPYLNQFLQHLLYRQA